MRSEPVETARRFVEQRFPDASLALVGGSVIRGDATPTSDLDIVILTERKEAPFRASYVFHEWPIEAFVHTEPSLQRFLAQDAERFRPSLHRMIAEGVVLRDRDSRAGQLQSESQAVIQRGPPRLGSEQLEDWRYLLTDLLDDFIGAGSLEEGMFVANDLAVELASLTLLRHRRWIGRGKWMPRAIRAHDPALAQQLASALLAYYRTEDKQPLIDLACHALQDAGGRLFEGYYRAAPRE